MAKTDVKIRKIGSVVVFDLFGSLRNKLGDDVKDRLEGDIQEGNYTNVILNAQGVEATDELTLRKILVTMERPVRKAIFCDDGDFFKALSKTYLSNRVPVCRTEEEIVDLFGAYLLERGKRIGTRDRRRNPRIKMAIPIGIEILAASQEAVLTKAIVTNLSDGGVFAEYLDWKSARAAKNIPNITDLEAKVIFRHSKTGNETRIASKILRFEETDNQIGVAVQYVKE